MTFDKLLAGSHPYSEGPHVEPVGTSTPHLLMLSRRTRRPFRGDRWLTYCISEGLAAKPNYSRVIYPSALCHQAFCQQALCNTYVWVSPQGVLRSMGLYPEQARMRGWWSLGPAQDAVSGPAMGHGTQMVSQLSLQSVAGWPKKSEQQGSQAAEIVAQRGN